METLVDFTDMIWLDAEFCDWCGQELPPVYEETDIMECTCGRVVDRLDEFSDTDIILRGAPNADGRQNWGPLNRGRDLPITSGYPHERRFPNVGKSCNP